MLKFVPNEEKFKEIREYHTLVKWEGKPLDPLWKDKLEFSFNTHLFKKGPGGKDGDGIIALCEINNGFFQTLPIETQWLFFCYFKDSFYFIEEMSKGTHETYHLQKEELTNLTQNVFVQNVDLYTLLLNYVNSLPLTIPDMKDKGTRVKDSPEKTFGPDHYPMVHAFAMVAKLLVPVIGETLEVFKHLCGTEGRELYTFEIIEPIFIHPKSGFREIAEKIHFYIMSEGQKTLKNHKNKNPNKNTSYVFSMTNQGFCKDRFLDYIEAYVVCRKLVSFDFFKMSKPGQLPDIMVCISKGATMTTDSKLSSFHKNTPVMALFNVKESSLGEDNTSHIEHGSKISKVPYDVNKTVELSLEQVIPRVLFDLNIDEEQFNQCVWFYEAHSINQSIFNIAMTSSLLSKYTGGSSMIYRLRSTQYIKLISIVQLKMAQWGLFNIIPFVSCYGSDVKSSELSPLSTVNKNFDKLKEFTEFKRLCPGTSERILTSAELGKASKSQVTEIVNVTTQVSRVVNWCIDFVHKYNLPDFLLELVSTKEHTAENGEVIPLDAQLARNICRYFVHCHSKEPITF